MRRFIYSILLLAAIMGSGMLLNRLTARNNADESIVRSPADEHVSGRLSVEYTFVADSACTIIPDNSDQDLHCSTN